MQARPAWPPTLVIRGLRLTASQATAPDDRVGYGIPDGAAVLRWIPDTASVPGLPPFTLGLRLTGPNPLTPSAPVTRVDFGVGAGARRAAAARLRRPGPSRRARAAERPQSRRSPRSGLSLDRDLGWPRRFRPAAAGRALLHHSRSRGQALRRPRGLPAVAAAARSSSTMHRPMTKGPSCMKPAVGIPLVALALSLVPIGDGALRRPDPRAVRSRPGHAGAARDPQERDAAPARARRGGHRRGRGGLVPGRHGARARRAQRASSRLFERLMFAGSANHGPQEHRPADRRRPAARRAPTPRRTTPATTRPSRPARSSSSSSSRRTASARSR